MLKTMKFFVSYIIIIAAGLIINGCDSPAPTQLFQDPTSTQTVQVVAKDTSDIYYNNGFDTTGVTDQSTNYTNVITVSGTKVTQNGFTKQSAYAQALFYDVSHPVTFPNGKTGYWTLPRSALAQIKISFDNYPAFLWPYGIGYSKEGSHMDTSLGYQFILNGNYNGEDDFGFKFHYNSSIRFQYANFNILNRSSRDSASFDIPTPQEIIGKVKLTGSLASKTLSATVSWNKENSSGISVIIGATTRNLQSTFPLYTLNSGDSGSLVIPSQLLNQIPGETYSKLTFTFVRKIEFDYSGKNISMHVLSQSVHSIILNIP